MEMSVILYINTKNRFALTEKLSNLRANDFYKYINNVQQLV